MPLKSERINIIGASGTGKTTLGKALSARLSFSYFDSDDYYHLPTDPPFRQARSPDERLKLVEQDLGQHPTWILSGAVANWQPTPRLDYSLVIFLYLPPEIRLARLRKRESQLYSSRILKGGDMAEDHQFFMNWTSGYDLGSCEGTNTLPHHEAVLKSLTCSSLRLSGPMTVEEQIQRILQNFNDT